MRKILIGFLIVLLVIMAYLMIFKGLELGDFKVLSASQIVEENDRLTKEISDTEELINSRYPTENDKLNTSVSKLLTAKDEYLELASVSTKSELSKASTVETYTVERTECTCLQSFICSTERLGGIFNDNRTVLVAN